MKLVCEQKDLLKGLVIASKAISINNTLPILNNILIKAEGQKLYFSATNLEIAVEYYINAEVKNEGTITIPSKIITNYVNFLQDEKLKLTSKESNLLIHSSSSETEINGLPASEYPTIPKTTITKAPAPTIIGFLYLSIKLSVFVKSGFLGVLFSVTFFAIACECWCKSNFF
jgi:DNA polymerase-3 subunit beta